MDERQRTRVSRRLSLILRHDPGSVGIVLDAAGWVDVVTLLTALAKTGVVLSRDDLAEVVAGNDKQRFAFSDDGTRIRASQGHSVPVDLGYAPAEPPAELFHGTVERFLPTIRADGLRKGSRHHVHLSADRATATAVGDRRGERWSCASTPPPCTGTATRSCTAPTGCGWWSRYRRGTWACEPWTSSPTP